MPNFGCLVFRSSYNITISRRIAPLKKKAKR